MSTAFDWPSAPDAEFAVIGHPVSHSLSPQMHAAAYRFHHLPYRYVAIEVPPGEVGIALEHLRESGYRGVNVTVPHKAEALAWAITADDFSTRVGAANTFNLPDRSCINTDGPGFIRSISDLKPGRCLLLGAGGSSRAIALALVEAGWEVAIYNRTPKNAVALVQDLAISAQILQHPIAAGCSLVINATSSSLRGDSIPVDWQGASAGAVAYDLMYDANPTPFLTEAGGRGLTTIDGRSLLVHQGALAFTWWTGLAAPIDAMTREIQ